MTIFSTWIHITLQVTSNLSERSLAIKLSDQMNEIKDIFIAFNNDDQFFLSLVYF